MAAPYTAGPILLKCSTTDVTIHKLITVVSAVSSPIEMIKDGKFLYIGHGHCYQLAKHWVPLAVDSYS